MLYNGNFKRKQGSIPMRLRYLTISPESKSTLLTCEQVDAVVSKLKAAMPEGKYCITANGVLQAMNKAIKEVVKEQGE